MPFFRSLLCICPSSASKHHQDLEYLREKDEKLASISKGLAFELTKPCRAPMAFTCSAS